MGPELWRPIEAPARQVFSTGEPQRVDFCAATPIGKRHFECRLFPESETAGEIDSLIGIITDWTERKQTEDALRESEERYRALISHVKSYAIFAVDLEGRMTTWNEGVERLLGWEREEFLKLSIDQLFSAEDVKAELPRRQLHQAAEEGSAASEVWLHRKDGTPFFASGMFSRAMDASGHVMGFSVVLRDRTAWKRAQEERDALLESERRIRLDAEQASRLKDEFLATLSHELRTPLNAILGWTRLLRGHALPESSIEPALEKVERNAQMQARLVEDLLEVSRITTGKLRLDSRPVDLVAITRTALESIGPLAENRGLTLERDIADDTMPTSGDPDRLHQVIWNLLANAVKFTPPGGTVRVTLRRMGEVDELIVSDNGIGIEPSFLPNVFETFRQADASSTRAHGGLGLGLSIVRHLVEAHGGTVTAESAGRDQGATFTVRLPVRAARPAGSNNSGTFPLEGLLQDLSAVVVSDDPAARERLQAAMEAAGANVREASSADEAAALCRAAPTDILVSDLAMPHRDGYSLMEELRTAPAGVRPRIAVALSERGEPEDRARSIHAGFDEHVATPVDPAVLVRMLSQHLRRGPDVRAAGPDTR